MNKKNPMMKKNLRHLRNLRDKKQIYTDDSPRFYTFYLVISLFNHTFASNFKVVHFLIRT